MIPGGNTRAELAAAIVARLTAERDAVPVSDDWRWNLGARVGLARAIDIVTELAEGAPPAVLCHWCDWPADDCYCPEAGKDDG